jgi:hypothetical protein
MVGISSARGFRVTARKITESILSGIGYRCPECGGKLTEEEVRIAYQLRTTQPRCGVCGGYSVDPMPEQLKQEEAFKSWRDADRATELIH